MDEKHDLNDDLIWREVFKRQLNLLFEQQIEMDVRLEEASNTAKEIRDSTRELIEVMHGFKSALMAMDLIGKFLKPFALVSSISLGAITAWFSIKGGK